MFNKLALAASLRINNLIGQDVLLSPFNNTQLVFVVNKIIAIKVLQAKSSSV